MSSYKPFSNYYYGEDLPMITVNLLNEIIDYNFCSTQEDIDMSIGDTVQLRPLSHSYDKSFPYTAVLTVNEKEYLACVCLAGGSAYHIYFSDIFSKSPDMLLLTRFIIEYKYAEKEHKYRKSLSSPQNTSALDFFNSLVLLSGDNSRTGHRSISKECFNNCIERLVERYKEKFPEKNNVSFSFVCDEDAISFSENIVAGVITLLIISMSYAKTSFTLTYDNMFDKYTYSAFLDGVKITDDIFSHGFPGLFLSHMKKLNLWKTEQTYSDALSQTVIKISVSKPSGRCRLHSQSNVSELLSYASMLAEILLF